MKEWLKYLLLGVLSVVFGVIVLGNTFAASLAVTTLTGAVFLVSGAFQIVGGFSAEGAASKFFSILLGALMAFLGVSFLFNPLEGVISLAFLIVILLISSGIVRIVFSWRMQGTRFFWPMLISGALSVLLGGYILANFATASVNILGILLGIELLFNGAGFVVMAFFLRAMGGRLK
ncbi:DUF308 domain-containing protein [Defluviimonas sp. D31]|uniref:HdeD family acid-resistance protein n=1 Tax=Defluviimonas sp. D31 TaxID=3083253 RepID=UPI00296ECC60|nr:DUF308 domain-containing protein [Defluviimonas sp. D31]MDW4549698.1 DUF308 domain-containing protein [Defluviimonas sp. D31]